MLCELIIRNFVSIKNLHLHFFPGFSVITGETGIGKSLIFNALSVVLGGRLQSKFSKDQEKIFIEAKFTKEESLVCLLKEHNIPNEEFLIFKKNTKLYLNNKLINVKLAQKIAQHLITLHHQKHDFDFSKLLDKGLDLSHLRNAYQAYVAEHNKYVSYLDQKKKIEQNESYWNMAKNILEAINPKEGEELILLQELGTLKESENLIRSAQFLEEHFNTPVDLLVHISKMMRGCSGYFLKDINVSYSHLLDLREKITEIKERYKDSQKKIEDINERLMLLRTTAKKLNTTTDQLHCVLKPLEKITDYDKGLLECALHKYQEEAEKVSTQRQQKAKEILISIDESKGCLNLDKLRLKIEHKKRTTPHLEGFDLFVLLCATQLDFPFLPFEKIASGGEMSRLQLLLAKFDARPALLFDEIDTGISGALALAVGRVLKNLSHQIIAITHSPQVAACADHQYVVKENFVEHLDSKERKIHNIALILSGATAANLESAKELYDQNSKGSIGQI